ncbi:MAG: phytoene desaturase family protein [Candidatus Nanopelagicales bacterium]
MSSHEAPSSTNDVVIIGSGINGLVAGALLARAGRRVLVVERNPAPGGAMWTSTDHVPGFTIELLSSWHPLFVGGPAYAALAPDLARHGLEYRNTTLPTGVISRDGSAFISTDPEVTATQMARLGDLDNWNALMADFGSKADLAFGLLGTDFWRRNAWKFGWKAYRQLGRRGLLESGADLLEPAGPWADRTFSSPVTKALLAPWALHNGLGPDDAGSAFITTVIAAAIAMGGMPVPVGGGRALVDALVSVITEHGGRVETDTEIVRVTTTRRGSRFQATGVLTADGRHFAAKRAVLASVTPPALYGGLLSDTDVDPARMSAVERFRFGRAGMQIHLALDEPPRWNGDPRLAETALIHILDGMDSLSESVNAANRGYLPARPTIVVGQPATVDPTRVPEGKGLLWIQLQENPRHVIGDLAGRIDPGDGSWTPRLRDEYAERIINQLEQHIPNIRSAQIARYVLGPADLEAMNVNLVGGDPYAGDCRVDQYALWRPLATATGHDTGVANLWHIGASTHPGPGLGGGSGYQVAMRLLGS